MSKALLNTLMQQIKTLSLEDQRALNSLLCANIRHGMKVTAIEKSTAVGIGDIVTFDGKTRGPIYIEVNGFSRDRTKIKGRQVNKGWTSKIGTQWTVGATIVKQSTIDAALAA